MLSPKKALLQPTPTIFVILDGFGLLPGNKNSQTVNSENAPFVFESINTHSFTFLSASGKDVGLFPGQEGNSEAGHLNIGAGRVVEQDLVHISRSIESGLFFKNEAFKQALFHAKKYGTAVHVLGLLTDDESAHAKPEHLYALLDYFDKNNQEKVYLHLFTDGRDSGPHQALQFLSDLREHFHGREKVATIMGRFYAMDRNKIWHRTERAYNAMVLGEGFVASSAEEAIKAAYARGENDEYIQPTVITSPGEKKIVINDNDVIYFFNARSDRARQLTKAFVQDNFSKENEGSFDRKKVPQNTRFVAMTDFGPDLPGIFTAFPSPDVPNCLAKAIGENYRQLYISETEKYAHVTYFLNGGYAEPINGEKRELVRSSEQYSYADKPEMHAEEVTARIKKYLQSDSYNFICVNFPNADMVGHTGNQAATAKAIQVIDRCLRELASIVLAKGGQMIVTADHGNAEKIMTTEAGEKLTEHTANPVPFIIIKNGEKIVLRPNGKLADVAPTILKLLKIKKPKEMTGRSLY